MLLNRLPFAILCLTPLAAFSQKADIPGSSEESWFQRFAYLRQRGQLRVRRRSPHG
jgi:hypothetical protein